MNDQSYPTGSNLENHRRGFSSSSLDGRPTEEGVDGRNDRVRGGNEHPPALDPHSLPAQYKYHLHHYQGGPSPVATFFPQPVLQPSYNIHPMHLSGQPAGYDSSNASFPGNPQSIPYLQGRPNQSRNVLSESTPDATQFIQPVDGRSENMPSLHEASENFTISQEMIPRHAQASQSPGGPIGTRASIKNSGNESMSLNKAYGHVPHTRLPSSDRNAAGITFRGPSIAYPQNVPNLSDSGLITGSRATDENQPGSQPGKLDGASSAARGDNMAPVKQQSEEPLLSWDEMSQAASRPTSSSQKDLQGKGSPDFQSKLNPHMDGGDELIESIEKNKNPDENIDHRKRKRNRTIRSCVPCHNHKRKVGIFLARRIQFIDTRNQCDRKRPCGRCIALGLVCA